MKSFLLHGNTPSVKWSMVPDGSFFEGTVPEGYNLACCPSGRQVILDVDVKNNKNGFDFIPSDIYFELKETFNYDTKSGGAHYWVNYTGDKVLMNTSTKYGLDLRIGKKGSNNGGYVKYHHNKDIRECVNLIKDSSEELNKWLESLFLGVNNYER